MRIRHLIFGLCIATPALALSADEPKLEMGRWEESITVQQVTLAGKALPLDLFKEANDKSAACYGRNDVRSAKDFFMSTAGSDCGEPTGQVALGAVDFAARCKMDDGTMADIAFKGSYNATSYDLVMTSTNDMDGKKLQMTGRMAGSFAGRCRGDEKE